MRIARVVSLVCVIAAVVVAVGAPQAQAAWSDEFNGANGTAVNSAIWGYDTGGGGWGNGELEVYNSGTANAWQENGYLRIQAKCCYTSARLKTQGKQTFSQGSAVEFRARGPMGQGLWPAGWALGANITTVPWPGCGEIDIMEHINSIGTNIGTMHWDFNGHASYVAAQPAVNFAAWNNYGLEWTSSLLRWKLNGSYVGDGNIAGGINGTEEFGPGKPFFIIMNLAVGGSWPGNPDGSTVFPANLDVDWIHVTGTSTGGGGTTATPTPIPGGTTIVNNGFYSVVNRGNGKCVDARGAAVANGTAVQQYTCNTTYAQQWQFQDVGGGYWRVNNRNSVPQVWDVSGVSTANGALINLWSYVAGANQQWTAESMGGGYYRFHARHSGRCLDVPGGAATESLQLQQYDCNTSNAQQFSLIQR